MTDNSKAEYVREPVQVYLDPPDLRLLNELIEATGLSKAELLRRGIRRLSSDAIARGGAGSSLDDLIGALGDSDAPTDLSVKHDQYLYGKPKHGRSRAR